MRSDKDYIRFLRLSENNEFIWQYAKYTDFELLNLQLNFDLLHRLEETATCVDTLFKIHFTIKLACTENFKHKDTGNIKVYQK